MSHSFPDILAHWSIRCVLRILMSWLVVLGLLFGFGISKLQAQAPPTLELEVDEYYATPDDKVTFKVVKQGGQNLTHRRDYTFTWSFNGQPIGRDELRLKIKRIKHDDEGVYTVDITHQPSQTVQQLQGVLHVQEAPKIIRDPEHWEVNTGDCVVYSVDAVGDALHYEWTKDGQIVSTQDHWLIDAVDQTHKGNVSVKVWNDADTRGDRARGKIRLKHTIPSSSRLGRPADDLYIMPEYQEVAIGSQALIELLKYGGIPPNGPPWDYMWWSSDGSRLTDQTSLFLPAVDGSDSRTYYNVISRQRGKSADSECRRSVIRVYEPPTIIQTLENTQVMEGNDATFIIDATGTDLEYEWSLNGQLVSTTPSWTLVDAALTDSGTVTSRVFSRFDPVGVETSFDLHVYPLIPSGPQLALLTSPQYVATGDTWTVRAQTVHNHEPYLWEWIDPQGQTVSTSETLELTSASQPMAGMYSVRVVGLYSGEFDDAQIELVVQDPIALLDVQGALVAPGDTAVLSVSVSGTEPVFTWMRQGQVVSTDPQLILSGAQLSDAGIYTVSVSNSVTNPPLTAQVTLRVLEPVQLVSPPTDAIVATGSAATLDVQASGSELQYVWYTPQNHIISSTSSAHLVNLLPSDSGTYTVRVFNELDLTGVMTTAQISVLDPPVITQAPTDITVTEGDAVTVQVTATGGDLNYRWELGGQVISTQDSWSVNTASLAQQGTVTVTVSNPVDTVGQSTSFTLTVEPYIPEGPSLELISSPLHVIQGGSLTLTASIPQNYESYSWAWRDAQGQVLSSSPTLSLSNLTTSSTYIVEVTGDISGLSDTQSIQITVQEAAVITEASGAVAATGSSATLTVNATGDDLTYIWSKGGQHVGSSSTLTLNNLNATDAGTYTITVSNMVTQPGDTRTVELEVLDLPLITSPPSDQVVATGSSASFSMNATGDQLAYTWTKGGQTLSTTSSFALNNVSKTDSGSYTVLVTNPVDQAGQSASATLTVLDPPVITTQPPTDIQIAAGQGFSLHVVATGDSLVYQWMRDGTDIPSANSSTYGISGSQVSQSGSYTVRVSNSVGEQVSNTATVLVEDIELVNIIRQPTDVVVEPGTLATFDVEATGDELEYQWLRNGQEIPGATASTYSMTTSLEDDGALISVHIFNRYSEDTSQTILVTVQDSSPPTLVVNPVDVAFTFDDTLTLSGMVQDNTTSFDAVEIIATSDQLPGVELTDFADSSGNFSMTLPLEVGINVLTFYALDEVGNVSDSTVITIERRVAVAPELTLTQPNRDIQTQATALDIRGEVITSLDAAEFTVTVAEQTVAVTPDGEDRYTFELLDIALLSGPNLIEAVVSSAQGTSRDQVVVERISTPGGGDSTIDLTLGTTRTDLWLSETTYTLTGEVTASDCVVDVRVNGVLPEQQDGAFTQTVTFSTLLTVPTTDGTAFPVHVIATGCSGQTVTGDLTLRVDLEEPVIAFDGISSGGVNVVVSNPYRLTGRITDPYIAGAILGSQPLTLVPSAIEGEWIFTIDVALERAVEREVVITAWDLGGNRSESSVNLRLDTTVSVRSAMPSDGEQVLVNGASGSVRFKVVAEQINSTDRVELRTDEGSFIQLTRADEFHELELVLDAGESYTAEIRVVDVQGNVLATTQTSFDVLDDQRVLAEIIGSEPVADATLIETNVPVRLTFNKALDPSKIFVTVRETVHEYVYDKQYESADLRGLSNIQRTLVSHEREVVPGQLQNLPGNRSFLFYPEREWTYGATLYVEAYYENTEVGRIKFETRKPPTLIHGFVYSASGLPLEGVRVELDGTGEFAITGSEGEYQFGWGWDANRVVPTGLLMVKANMDAHVSDYSGLELMASITKGQINSMPVISLAPVLQAQSTSTLTAGQVVSLDDGNLTLDLSSVTQIAQGQRSGTATVSATVADISATGYPIAAPTSGGVVFALTPSGISTQGSLSITMNLPFIEERRDYILAAYQTRTTPPSVWIIGLDETSHTLKVKGIATIDATQSVATSTELIEFERLDVVGIAFILPQHYPLLDQYHQNQLTLDALLQAIEVGQ